MHMYGMYSMHLQALPYMHMHVWQGLERLRLHGIFYVETFGRISGNSACILHEQATLHEQG